MSGKASRFVAAVTETRFTAVDEEPVPVPDSWTDYRHEPVERAQGEQRWYAVAIRRGRLESLARTEPAIATLYVREDAARAFERQLVAERDRQRENDRENRTFQADHLPVGHPIAGCAVGVWLDAMPDASPVLAKAAGRCVHHRHNLRTLIPNRSCLLDSQTNPASSIVSTTRSSGGRAV